MPFSLLTKILYAAAAMQGVFLAFLIFRTKVNQPANRILAVLLLLLSFHLILVGFDEREFFMTFPHLSRISWIIGSLYWPLLFLFVQHLTHTQPARIWKSFWAFIPFLVFFFILLPWYTMSAEEKRAILDNFEESSKADFGWINQTVSLLHILFQSFLLVYYLRFERNLQREYSDVESMRIRWLKQFLILVLGVTCVAVFSFFVRTWNVPVLSGMYEFHFAGIVLLFYWLSYKALTHPVLFGVTKVISPPPISEVPAPESEKYKKSSIDQDQLQKIFETVRSVLEQRKLYLKADLTLTELSAASGVPRHQVSQAINSCYSGNFFDLINDYRIGAFTDLAAQPDKKNLTLLGIAQEAGFSSKATFYSVFRKKTGMTPAEYLENRSKAA